MTIGAANIRGAGGIKLSAPIKLEGPEPMRGGGLPKSRQFPETGILLSLPCSTAKSIGIGLAGSFRASRPTGQRKPPHDFLGVWMGVFLVDSLLK